MTKNWKRVRPLPFFAKSDQKSGGYKSLKKVAKMAFFIFPAKSWKVNFQNFFTLFTKMLKKLIFTFRPKKLQKWLFFGFVNFWKKCVFATFLHC